MDVTPQQFYLETPLYTGIVIENQQDLQKYIRRYYTSEFHGYNPIQKLETTYSVYGKEIIEFVKEGFSKDGYYNIELRCKRSTDVFMFYVHWNSKDKTLTKIGQLPSVADFHIDQIKQYNKLFNNDKLKEFKKATGLAASGVGIGSFVYLRRIFEDLIYEAYDAFKTKLGEIADFNKKRMAEKIDALHDFLPEFLVENKELYGILSKGIHELTEKECLAHFDTVKVGIEMILDEKLEQLNKRKKADEARQKIQQAALKINQS